MIGAIIGDIIGSKYEFNNIKTKRFPLMQAGQNYTDDTLMTIAIGSALMRAQDGAKSFPEEAVSEMCHIAGTYPCPMGGYGGRFHSWLNSRDPQPYGSYGNGSAMRVSACGEAATSLERALELAKQSAEVTHNHPEGIKGAQAVAAAIYMARSGEDKESIRRYIEESFYPLTQTLDEIRPDYFFNESCQETVPQAIIAFLESESFEDALRNAVSLGGDCDTLTDITCAIAWAYYARSGCDKVMCELRQYALGLLPKELRDIVIRWENRYCGAQLPLSETKTEIVFILDRSGSMQGLEADTIGGFNSMLAKQKQEVGETIVSTVLFDDKIEVLHDRARLETIPPMTREQYFVRGCTALMDAISGAIHHIGNVHKYARAEDRPEHTLFIITTDGMENASRRYSAEQVRQMIERQKQRYGWEFLFLGANIDAVETASRFGISADRAVDYCSDSQGTQLNFEVLSATISSVRKNVPLTSS